jgi:class 3 adenylate cyclase
LFADLCNSTPLGEGIDPEELVNLRQQIEGIAIQVVEKHGGKVNPIHGDGVLAVFGHPTPTENDARRAVEAAVELHETTRQTVWTSMPRGFEVRLHSAVHAGRVFAQKGDALHGRYDLLGDAVNTASRLCEAADRDEILVSDSILSGIEAFFLTEEAGPLP